MNISIYYLPIATLIAAYIFVYMTILYTTEIKKAKFEPNVMPFATRTLIALINVISFTLVVMNNNALQDQELSFWCKSSMSAFSFIALAYTLYVMLKVKNIAKFNWASYTLI